MHTSSSILVLALAAALVGCGGDKPPPPAPHFEMRDFVVNEEKKPATQYLKEWNTFTGTGTIVARNVDKHRNLVVVLEIRDESKGPSSEPDLRFILVRGGVGKIEIKKSKFQEVSPPPRYAWNVLGWYELNKATIEAPGTAAK